MRQDFEGLAYHDRHAKVAAEGAQLTIYVPKPGHEGSIKPRSAIVGPAYRIGACQTCGQPDNCGDCNHTQLTQQEWAMLGEDSERWPLGGTILCHLEAWLNGPAQYGDRDARGQWEAGVVHAAGRAFVDYPTVARAACMRFDLIPVGTIAAAGNTVTITDEGAITEWLSR